MSAVAERGVGLGARDDLVERAPRGRQLLAARTQPAGAGRSIRRSVPSRSSS